MVKTDSHQDDQEYVTSFYKRVQHKVKDRDGLFANDYPESSLPLQPHSEEETKQQPKQRRRPFSFLQKTVSQDAAVVRGGAASSVKRQSPPLNLYSIGDKNHRSNRKRSSLKTPSRNRETAKEYDREEDLYIREYEEDVEGNDLYASQDEDQDDYPPGEHHLGLLRVPCSIAINSGEDVRYNSYGEVQRGRGGGFDEPYGKFRVNAPLPTS